MRKVLVLSLMAVLTGCAGIQNTQPDAPELATQKPVEVLQSSDFCLVESSVADFDHQCDLVYWVNFWIKADASSWPERKKAIAGYGTDISGTLHKIVLSLPVDTPYQDRLRAQHWLNSVKGKLSSEIMPLINTVVEAPNTEMLELESAMVVLNKVNAEQNESNEALQDELEAQRKKLEELLEIEATLMDKSRSSQQ